jgi:hypothetical protein
MASGTPSIGSFVATIFSEFDRQHAGQLGQGHAVKLGVYTLQEKIFEKFKLPQALSIEILNSNILTTYDWAINTGLLAEKGGRSLNTKIVNQTAATFLEKRLKIKPRSFNSAGTQLLSHIFNTVYAKASDSVLEEYCEELVEKFSGLVLDFSQYEKMSSPQKRLSKQDIIRLGTQVEGLLPGAYSRLSLLSFRVQKAVARLLRSKYFRIFLSFMCMFGYGYLMRNYFKHKLEMGKVFATVIVLVAHLYVINKLIKPLSSSISTWVSRKSWAFTAKTNEVQITYLEKEGEKLYEVWSFIMSRNQSIKWMT